MAAGRSGNEVSRSVPQSRPREMNPMLDTRHDPSNILQKWSQLRQAAPQRGALWVDIICILFTVPEERVVRNALAGLMERGFS